MLLILQKYYKICFGKFNSNVFNLEITLVSPINNKFNAFSVKLYKFHF